MKISDTIRQPGGIEATQLRVAQQYVKQSGEFAKAGTTMIVPANLSDIAGMVAMATKMFKTTDRASRTLNSVTGTWAFDALGRLTTLGDPIGNFTFAYDGVTSRLQTLTYPNGQTSTYTYAPNSGDRRLASITHQTSGSATLSAFSYAYDIVGNITTWTQQYQSTTRAYDFAYDATDQLTSATYRTTGGAPTILNRYGYAYDAVGNRTAAEVDDVPVGSTFDNLNHLVSQSATAPLRFEGTVNEASTVKIQGKPVPVDSSGRFAGTAAVTSGTNTIAIAATDASGNTATQNYEVDVPSASGSFTYDANGNMTAHGTKTYEWDAANRLVTVSESGTPIATFTYDGAGRRATKTTGGVTHSYVYDGDDIIQDRTSSATLRHIHGPGVDRPLATVDGSSAVSYYLADHLGNIVQVTDASATVMLQHCRRSTCEINSARRLGGARQGAHERGDSRGVNYLTHASARSKLTRRRTSAL